MYRPARHHWKSPSAAFAGLHAAALLWVLSCGSPALAAELSGMVVRVADGDTITILGADHAQHKSRLSGIDAPELKQAFGRVSKRHLSDLVAAKQVTVEWDKHDSYGRILGKVLVGGQDVNLQQVEAGLAWHFKRYEMEQPEADRAAYSAAEEQARGAHRGLWAQGLAVPPWEFRKTVKKR